jgi:hypothetical protein
VAHVDITGALFKDMNSSYPVRICNIRFRVSERKVPFFCKESRDQDMKGVVDGRY